MGPISFWPFYNQMEELDSNPAPISARPLTRLPPNSSSHYQEDQEDQEEDDNYEEEDERQSKSRSINYILRRPGSVNRFAGVGGGLLSWGQRDRSSKRKRNKNDGDGGERRRKGVRAVAAEIRAFAERVMVMEKRKMEFAKETVKLRKEMEIRRIDLIQSSQAQLLEFLNNAFDSSF